MPLTHYLDTPVIAAQTWISQSATLQGILGVGSPSLAANSIYLYDTPPGGFAASRVIVGAHKRSLKKVTGDGGWNLTGRLFAEFQLSQQSYFSPGNPPQHSAAGANFASQVSAILDDILPLCGQTVGGVSFLDIIELEEEGPPMACDPAQNQGKYFWQTLWVITHRG